MRRMLWLGVGLAIGALVVRQVTKAAQAYSPSGIAQTAANSAAGLWESVQDFIADVREGMAEREEQIHAAFINGDNLADLPDVYGDTEYGDTEYGDTEYFDYSEHDNTGYDGNERAR